jgi:hypothetical protein
MKPYVKIALFVVLFIALTTILAALILYNKKHTDMAKSKPDFVVPAAALQKEFEDNEATASAKYINKIIEVTGTIASVTLVDSNNLNISLKTGSDISSVICTLPAVTHPAKFRTGDEIILRGECSGYTQIFPGEPPLDVLLNNCAAIVNKK